MKIKDTATVTKIDRLATGIYSMWLKTEAGKLAKPGQFVNVYTKNDSKLLPRPISICEANDEGIRLVFRVVGYGTGEFSEYKEGDTVSIVGPVGNGYDVENSKEEDTYILIGGGIGIPPMLELSKRLKGKKIVVLGYRDELFLNEEFEKYADVYIATEDGSAGTKGNVIDAIKAENITGNMVFSCGPMPMLRGVKAFSEENGIDAFISLEERMACGVGACLGCVTKTKNKDHHSKVNNARICVDGPVFDAKEVMI